MLRSCGDLSIFISNFMDLIFLPLFLCALALLSARASSWFCPGHCACPYVHECARVLVYVRVSRVCSSVRVLLEQERTSEGKQSFAWWEAGALVSPREVGDSFALNFRIQLRLEHTSLDSFTGMEAGHWQFHPRSKRVLWDQYHNLRYPPGYFPRALP